MALKRQRTVIVDGKKYRIIVERRAWPGKYAAHKYSIKGPDLSFESFTNVRETIDEIADDLVARTKKNQAKK